MELRRPDLVADPRFAELFQIEPLPEQLAGPGGERRFAWTVVPRRAGDLAIPALRFRYYRPRFPPGRRMQTTYADTLPWAVAPAPPSVSERPAKPGMVWGLWVWLLVPAAWFAARRVRMRRPSRELARARSAADVAAWLRRRPPSPAVDAAFAATDAARFAPGGGPSLAELRALARAADAPPPAGRVGFAPFAFALTAFLLASRLTPLSAGALALLPAAFVLLAGATAFVPAWRLSAWAALAAASGPLAAPPDAVTAGVVALRAGNAERFPPADAAPLPAGAPLAVLAERGGWFRVRAAGGASGWLPAGDAVR